jgi:pyridoxamine 5'-phosphate oxidase
VVTAAAASIEADPDFVSSTWRAWCLVPDSVEFWQADPGRRHQRWNYRREPSGEGWTRAILWP